MRVEELLFLDLIFVVLHTECTHLLLTGSHYVSAETDHSLFLHFEGLTGRPYLNLTLKSTGHVISSQLVNLNSSVNVQQELYFEITNNSHPEYDLHVVYKNETECKEQSIKLINLSRRPVILIQLSKPIYKVKDEIKFRVFVLTQKLIPYNKVDDMGIVILDSKNKIQRKFMRIRPSKFGAYEDSVQLSATPNFGRWKIEVKVNGKKRYKYFDVQKFEENSLEVDINIPRKVSISDEKIVFVIKSKTSTETSFIDHVNVQASGNYTSDDRNNVISFKKDYKLNSLKKTLQLNIKDDLKILSLDLDTEVDIHLNFFDIHGKEVFNKNTKVLVTRRKLILLKRNKYFQPGLKYTLIVEILSFSDYVKYFFTSLNFRIQYYFSNDTFQEFNLKIIPKKSEMSTYLLPPIETVEIKMNVTYGDTELVNTIEMAPSQSKDEFMNVALIGQLGGVNDDVRVSVETTAKFETLHALVISPNGIVYSKKFEIANDKKTFQFTLRLTEMMLPESKLLVYYIRQRDGVLIYNYVPLIFKFSVDFSLKLILPNEPIANQLTFNIKAAENSMIFLSSNDQISTQGNEITENSIKNEVFDYKNIKFSQSSPYDVNNLGAFVIQPMNGVACDENNPTKSGSYKDEDKESISNVESIINNYIPDIWLHESIKIENSRHNFTSTTPMTSATWKVSGIAMNPSRGLSLLQQPFEVSVENNFEPVISTPSMVVLGEIFSFEYNVKNLNTFSLSVTGYVKLENGNFIQSKIKYDNNVYKGECLEFEQMPKIITGSFEIPPFNISSARKYLIKAHNVGVLRIEIKLNDKNSTKQFTTEKIIKVQNSQEMITKKSSSHFIIGTSTLTNEPRNVTKNIIENKIMKIYGNLLGSVIKSPDSIIEPQIPLDEQTFSKLAVSTIVHNFLTSNNLKDHPYTKNALNLIWLNYQETLSVLQNILAKNDSSDFKMVAFIAQIMTDAEEIIQSGNNDVQKCLEYLKKYQNTDGSFKLIANVGIRSEIGNQNSKSNVITALGLLALSKKQYDKYKNQTDKSVSFLKSQESSFSSNYEKAITAYAFVLNNQKSFSEDLLSKTTEISSFSSDQEHLAMNIEVISYIILAKILLNNDPQSEIKWLLDQRSLNGAFHSPYNTILALQALSEYTKYKNNQHPNLHINFGEDIVNISNIPEEEIRFINHTVQVSGTGFGYATFQSDIHLINLSQTNYFNMSHKIYPLTTNEIYIVISFQPLAPYNNDLKLLVVEVHLPLGYRYVTHDMSPNIKITKQNSENLVIFNISEMKPSTLFQLTIKAKRVSESYENKARLIKFYDWNRQNLMYIQSYIYDQNLDICSIDEKKNYEKLEEKRKKENDAFNEKERNRCQCGFLCWFTTCKFRE